MTSDKTGVVNRGDEDKSKESTGCIRMRFGRIIKCQTDFHIYKVNTHSRIIII